MKKIIVTLFALLPIIALAQSTIEKKEKPGFDYVTQSRVTPAQDEFSKNYNTGVGYYNRAVNRLMQSNSSTTDLKAVQQETLDIFKKSLPYLEAAYIINPLSKNLLTALSGVYFATNDTEKYSKMQTELSALK